MADATKWVTVKVPESDHEQADDYKPDGVTWGDCLVAGAERLNDHRDSDTSRFDPGPGPFEAEAEIHVTVSDEDLEAIREDVADAVNDGTDAGLGPVTLDASERSAIAEEVVKVLRE